MGGATGKRRDAPAPGYLRGIDLKADEIRNISISTESGRGVRDPARGGPSGLCVPTFLPNESALASPRELASPSGPDHPPTALGMAPVPSA
jgi:hypothetical protein